MANKIPDIDIADFNFRLTTKEAIDILAGKTDATELKAVQYGDLYPTDDIMELDQTPLLPANDPDQDNHATRKRYVDKMDRRAFFFGVLNG